MAIEKKELAAWDWVIIGIYFAICMGLGVYSKFSKQKKNGEESAEGYFLAGRSMLWWAVGGSLYASNMGSEHFVGLAGSGAASGIGVVAYEWHASWILLLLGFFFVPVYIRSKIFTMPEYLLNRFQSRWMRMYLTVVSLISYITTKIAVDLYAGSLFIKEAVGLNMYLSSVALLVFTAIYTLLGGLTAVIYTDVLQCTLMVVGALALSIIGFKEVGGLNALWEKYPLAVPKPTTSTLVTTIATTINTSVTPTMTSTAFTTIATSKAFTAIATTANMTTGNSSFMAMMDSVNNTVNNTCYKSPENWNHMFRPLDDSDLPWIGAVFSLPITGIWYWCTDQVIVQRTLGAKNMVQARLGTILAGFLKLLPLYIMVMPGMIARVLFPEVIACAGPDECYKACENKYGCSNKAYPQLVLHILPTGLMGLMLAVMVAALMSSLSSAFNSASTIFTMDIYRVIRPRASNKELLNIGRLVVVVLVGVGVAWIPIVSRGHDQLFLYIQTIQSYLAPPTCAVFLVGMLWPRLTEVGALTSMLFGLLLACIRLGMDIGYPKPHCGEVDDRPSFVKLHFTYYALIMFFACILLMCSISLFTRPVPLEMLGALTWKTLNKPRYRGGRSSGEYVVSADMKLDEANVTNPGNVAGSQSPLAEVDQEELDEIAEFEEQSTLSKWGVRVASLCLIFALLFLWIWYR